MPDIKSGALLVILLTSLISAQDGEARGMDDVIREFRAAEENWSSDLRAWKKLRSRLASEKQKPPPSPPHPFGRFAPRVAAIARSRAGTDDAALALSFLIAPSRRADPYAHPDYPMHARFALRVLAKAHAEHPAMAGLSKRLANRRYLVDEVGLEPIASFTAAVRASSHGQATKAYASFTLARAWHRLASNTKIDARRVELMKMARGYFAHVATAPVGIYKELASRFVVEIDTSQPGMPALATQGKSGRGETVRLADFRGRVVLVDFWGFW